MTPHRSAGTLAVIGAVIVFSSSSSIVKWADTSGPVVAFWRMLGAVAMWWIVIVVRRAATGRPPPSRQVWRAVLPAGLCFGFNISIFFTAVTRTSIAHAEFIPSLSPLLLVPAGALLFGERPDRRALPWGAVSILGLAIVLSSGGGGEASLGGDLLVLVAVLTWVAYLLLARRARATADVVDFMATMMPIGVLTAGPVAALIAIDELWPLSAKGWIAAGLLTVLTGMVSHGLIAFAQREVDVGTISILQVGQPALAVGWAFLILGEEITVRQVPGMVLVIAGLVVFVRTSQRRSRAGSVVADTRGELAGTAG
ncbi:MAG: DMT family transporter [Acidimicrobiia bacterium]|nr:DMT family transporter [Acidimicrobiia bacterium]